jgi:hypothetical protein
MSTRVQYPRLAAAVAASVLVAGFAIATHAARAQGAVVQRNHLTHNDAGWLVPGAHRTITVAGRFAR